MSSFRATPVSCSRGQCLAADRPCPGGHNEQSSCHSPLLRCIHVLRLAGSGDKHSSRFLSTGERLRSVRKACAALDTPSPLRRSDRKAHVRMKSSWPPVRRSAGIDRVCSSTVAEVLLAWDANACTVNTAPSLPVLCPSSGSCAGPIGRNSVT
jgi:hypothetical protein